MAIAGGISSHSQCPERVLQCLWPSSQKVLWCYMLHQAQSCCAGVTLLPNPLNVTPSAYHLYCCFNLSGVLMTPQCPPWSSVSTSFPLLCAVLILSSVDSQCHGRHHLSLLGSSIRPSIFCIWHRQQHHSIQYVVQSPLPVRLTPCSFQPAAPSSRWNGPNHLWQ
jgi:hypothetical protein